MLGPSPGLLETVAFAGGVGGPGIVIDEKQNWMCPSKPNFADFSQACRPELSKNPSKRVSNTPPNPDWATRRQN